MAVTGMLVHYLAFNIGFVAESKVHTDNLIQINQFNTQTIHFVLGCGEQSRKHINLMDMTVFS